MDANGRLTHRHILIDTFRASCFECRLSELSVRPHTFLMSYARPHTLQMFSRESPMDFLGTSRHVYGLRVSIERIRHGSHGARPYGGGNLTTQRRVGTAI